MSGIAALLVLFAAPAPGSAYGPAPPAPSAGPAAAPTPAADPCAAEAAGSEREISDREIVICAPKPEGYRLDPDVMEARREYRRPGGPRRPERYRNGDCATIGPMGCRGGVTFDFLQAAAVLGSVAVKAAKGEDWTEPLISKSPSEYELYKEARARREAREAEDKAEQLAKAVKAGKEAAAATPAGER